MKETDLHTSHLFHACHVLFGPEIKVSLDFIHYLQMPGLKAAFRRKALETHPDRAAMLALQTPELEEQFKEVNAAYRNLYDYLENPLKFRLIHDISQKERPGQGTFYGSPDRSRNRERAYERYQCANFKGTAPAREVPFGRYLYYQGLISYKQLIDAIVWQKVQRPLIGNLAQRWRFLREQEVSEILKQRRAGEKFGECALRYRYLTMHDLQVLLGRQRLIQPRIGKYFVEKRILLEATVETMAEKLRRHNWKYKSRE